MRPSIERANQQLDPRQQLANTPPPQSTTPGLHPVSIHQMAPPKRTYNCSLLLIYRPRKDEKLSWLSWLTCSGRFTHIMVTRRLQAERRTGSVHQPKTGVLPTVPRNQPTAWRMSLDLYVLTLSFSDAHALISQTTQSNVDRTPKIYSHILPTLPWILHGVHEFQIWPRFSKPVGFDGLWLQNRRTYRKPYTWATMIDLRSNTEISPTPPQFLQGGEVR